jgi:hypothetical protein
VLQTGFHLLPLGRIEHQRDLDVRHQTRGELVHVGDAIAADVIDVDVKNVRAFALLFLAKRDEAVPVFRVEQIAHLLRTARVHALAHNQERCVLDVWLLEVDRRCCRDQFRVSLLWRDSLRRLDEQLEVRRSRARNSRRRCLRRSPVRSGPPAQ